MKGGGLKDALIEKIHWFGARQRGNAQRVRIARGALRGGHDFKSALKKQTNRDKSLKHGGSLRELWMPTKGKDV